MQPCGVFVFVLPCPATCLATFVGGSMCLCHPACPATCLVSLVGGACLCVILFYKLFCEHFM